MGNFSLKNSIEEYSVFAITNSWPPLVSGHGRFFFQLLKNHEKKLVIAPKSSISEIKTNSSGVYNILKYSSSQHSSKINSLLQHLEILILPLFIIFKLKHKPKIVITSQVLFSGLTAYFIKLIFGIPYVIIAHGEEFSTYYHNKFKFKYFFAKIVSQNSEIIISNSYNTSEILNLFYSINNNKIRIIHPIVDISESNIDETLANKIKNENFLNKRVILMVGRLYEERKGFDVAIEAFYRVKKIYNDVSLVIIGPGDNSKLYDLVVSRNLTNDVHFLGKLERNLLLNYFFICDIFLMPNRTLSNGDLEGFGIVFLEANMFGKPVIGGASGGTIDAIQDMVSGLLVDGESIDEVEHSLIRLISDDNLRIKLGISARNRVLSEFNEDVQSKKFEMVLNEVIL